MRLTLAEQAQALAFATRLAELHPSLPAPSLGVSHCAENKLNLCFSRPAEVEAWREALYTPSGEMTCEKWPDGRLEVGFDTTVNGVSVHAFAIFGDKQPEGAGA